MRRLTITVGSTAVAGLLGFVIGRHSAALVIAGETSPVPIIAAAPTIAVEAPTVSAPAGLPVRDRAVVKVQIPESEALVRFVMPAKRSVGLFGGGPLEQRSTSSQLE
jgi:hypothetical protein